MYERFYNFTGMPFLLTPDSRFFFGSSGHSRAMAHLVYGLSQEEGFIVITGEVGAGKTTLVEQLCCAARPRRPIPSPASSPRGSPATTCCAWSWRISAWARPRAWTRPRCCAVSRHDGRATSGRMGRCLLVVDEVQNLSVAALEELRMLSNITVDGRASLQTILLGQPQFRPMLASPDLEQLRQRVLASYHLGPLTEAGNARPISSTGWRRSAGRTTRTGSDAAFSQVFRETEGIPRRINTLCSRVLLYAALDEAHTITAPWSSDRRGAEPGPGRGWAGRPRQPAPSIPLRLPAAAIRPGRAGPPRGGAGTDRGPAAARVSAGCWTCSAASTAAQRPSR